MLGWINDRWRCWRYNTEGTFSRSFTVKRYEGLIPGSVQQIRKLRFKHHLSIKLDYSYMVTIHEKFDFCRSFKMRWKLVALFIGRNENIICFGLNMKAVLTRLVHSHSDYLFNFFSDILSNYTIDLLSGHFPDYKD